VEPLDIAGGLGGPLLSSAKIHADRPALWARGQSLSYRELFEFAGKIANGLVSAGIVPGDRVAILSYRSVTAYAGIIASLLAGCAYVPLNTRFPTERNRTILQASGARAIVVSDQCAAEQAQFVGDIDFGVLAITPESDAALLATRGPRLVASECSTATLETMQARPAVDRDAPAYILFTSGTTGAPKGVPISHGNLGAYLPAIHRLVPVGAEDRVLQAADLTFDLSVHDMFLTWLNGGQLISVPENAVILTPRIIAQQKITASLLVPSAASRASREGLLKSNYMPSLRWSLFAGEALPVATVDAWRAAAPYSEVFNLYGPTEGTIHVSWFRVDPKRKLDMAVVPIGRPVGEQRMSLFGSDGVEVPPGETGEIYLTGPQMTKGYWQAPRLDAEKFVTIGDERWYKTGDLGRYSEDHGVIFGGRADRQVKIRGYRVELQEVEGAVRAGSGIDHVAVVVWPILADGSADGCVAFIAGSETDPTAILERCRVSLPAYMIPSRIIFVDQLPLNANGKIDYRQLAQDPRLHGTAG
jgi:D-alanine--poly(phosphoribitol) ligase subunit 1